ncbi:hypothetical protein PQX77_015161 [Marasmius sp. AFHP31]|nr:hypothetical protein PQX77_015161 [Marasmius sp. AFHP31]
MPDKPATRATTWMLAHVELPSPPPQVPDSVIESSSKSERCPTIVSKDREQSVGIAGHLRREVLSDPVVQSVTDEVFKKMKREYETMSGQCPEMDTVKVTGNPSDKCKSQGGGAEGEHIQPALIPHKRRKAEACDPSRAKLRRREVNNESERKRREMLNLAFDNLQARLPLTQSVPPSRRFVVEEAVRFIDKLQEELRSFKANTEAAGAATTIMPDNNQNFDDISPHVRSGLDVIPGGQYGEEGSTRPAEPEDESDELINREAPYWSSDHVVSDLVPYDLYPQLYLPISLSARRVQTWYMPIQPGLVWL